MLKFYRNPHSLDGEGGYTGEEIQRGLHWINADVTCFHCGKEQPVAVTHHVGGPCVRCGKPTLGASADPAAQIVELEAELAEAQGEIERLRRQNRRMVDALRLIRYQSDAFDVAQVIETVLEGIPNETHS